MAVYVTKKCPHCGYAYQILESGDQRKYGCPYQTCMRCHKSYWDKDIKEPALHGYENFYETRKGITTGISLIIYVLIGILMFSYGILFVMEQEMIGFFAIAMGALCVWGIVSYIKQKIYDEKHRDDIIANQQRDYDMSMARLKDTNYLTALAKYDVLAKKLLKERINGDIEHYAKRPQ